MINWCHHNLAVLLITNLKKPGNTSCSPPRGWCRRAAPAEAVVADSLILVWLKHGTFAHGTHS